MEISWTSISAIALIIVWLSYERYRKTKGQPALWRLFRDFVNGKLGVDPDESQCPKCGCKKISWTWLDMHNPAGYNLFLQCQRPDCGWQKLKKK